jgi:alpha-tubulin suppressor-like RCC1 family protein
LKSLFIQHLNLALALVVSSLLLTACGSGVSEVANLPGTVTATHVVAGQSYTYKADSTNGTVTWVWGDGSPDTVGNAVQKVWNKPGSFSTTYSATAGGVATLVKQSTVVAGEPVTAGDAHTCALQPSGAVLCWGDNSAGQLGNGTIGASSPAAVAVKGLTDAIALSAGARHTCALKGNGSVACWGSNSSGQLGDGSINDKAAATTVVGLTDAVAISAGQDLPIGVAHTCALKANGSVVCWGGNTYGQLGDGTRTDRTTTVAVTGLSGVVALSAGSNHTCALKANGSAACWGLNTTGQLGTNPNADIPIANSFLNTKINPTASQVISLTNAVALSAGSYHTCALKANGSATCWGNNSTGELGDGTTAISTISATVKGITDAVAISAGGIGFNAKGSISYRGRTCALKANGAVACWGAIVNGGRIRAQSQATPTIVAGLTETTALITGAYHTCALKKDGSLACWGNNDSGQLGNGNVGGGIPTGLVNSTSLNALAGGNIQLSLGGEHSCAVNGGSVSCWGSNTFGQLGDGTTANSTTSRVVSSLVNAATITAGTSHTCALKSDTTVVCWGKNTNGQLGNGATTLSTTPSPVTNLSGVLQLSAGDSHTCAVKNSTITGGKGGPVVCWGNNGNGQLGDNSTVQSLIPVNVIGLTDAVAVSAGANHTCAVKADSSVVCWGGNFLNQLGNPNIPASQFAPITAVFGLTDTVELSAGTYHTCARKTDGTVLCWGGGGSGQLGPISPTSQATPTVAIKSAEITGLSSGKEHTCVVKTDGSVVCWGNNRQSQLSTTDPFPAPVLGLADAFKVSAGGDHVCAMLSDPSTFSLQVVCWGNNSAGQLGGSTTLTTNNPLPTPVLGGTIFWK